MTEEDSITVSSQLDGDGNELDNAFIVTLTGSPSYLYSITEDYFDTDEDAFEFACEVSRSTGTEICWKGIPPAWFQ